MALENFIQLYQPAIEAELQRIVALANQTGVEEMHGMLAYHMGWEGEGAGSEARGKRIRPLLVLLTAAACGGEWRAALPGAAAVELIHNFSLIHDDIQDQSPLRRGRPTIWTRWGVAQAINIGDTAFSLAQMALLELQYTVSPAVALRASQILQQTCLELTQGQYLDLSYEARGDLNLEAYWQMVGGKTAALLGACTQIGALAGGASEDLSQQYHHFGHLLGLAFQALDDLLGIWGDAALIGKSIESDLVSGKKSLPVLIGLAKNGAFTRRWSVGPITPAEAPALAAMLEAEGARQETLETASRLTDDALQALEHANPHGETGAALTALARRLLARET
jgi:geranylgeranyl diphosphate synthase, type I